MIFLLKKCKWSFGFSDLLQDLVTDFLMSLINLEIFVSTLIHHAWKYWILEEMNMKLTSFFQNLYGFSPRKVKLINSHKELHHIFLCYVFIVREK